MIRKINRILSLLTGTFSSWQDAECVLSEDEDLQEPLDSLCVSVFFTNMLPSQEERRKIFSAVADFEAVSSLNRDALLIENIPVIIEYYSIPMLNQFLARQDDFFYILRNEGTNLYYKLLNGKILCDNSAWLSGVREKISALPLGFWSNLRAVYQHNMEYCLAELNAAAIKDDGLFFMLTASDFIKTACSTLFIINKQFEPQGRNLYRYVKKLSKLPSDFHGHFEQFIRQSPEIDSDRKKNIGHLLAESIVRLN
jgi:hypothetical protein